MSSGTPMLRLRKEKKMSQAINFFAEEPGRFERFQEEFRAQSILDDSINTIIGQYSDKLKLRDGEERDLSLLLKASFFGKAQKTFQAVIRLCVLGYGEDALVLVRSNVNLLINICFILADNEPVKSAKEFVAYSIQQRSKYLDVAYSGKYPKWMQNLDMAEIKELAKAWETKIQKRAERLPSSASLLHYKQGYRFYSSFEHSDVMAISTYVQDRDKPSLRINSGPSDEFISIALAHNFFVMTDLFAAVLDYFGIQCLDIGEKLTAAWRALEEKQ
jgi:hypothetical protein